MKILKKVTAGVLAAMLLPASVCAAYADTGAGSSGSDGKGGSKEEVIYAMTDARGTLKSSEVVNIFGSGDITDYGDYSDVKMLNTSDKINQDGDKITFSTDAERVYYQGTLDDVQLPWDISIKYFLDGKERKPEDLAGKSGTLRIKISISENENCKGDFFDEYALQTSLQLDTEKCSDIAADGATVVNVGSVKQLTYTSLPGKGLEAEVTANVEDFEMQAVSVNGVKLDLDLDIDSGELESKMLQLVSAMEKLNSGADTLQEGSGNILSALRTANAQLAGSSADTSKLEELMSSSQKISETLAGIAAGAADLQKQCAYDSYKTVMAQNGLDIDSLKAGNRQAAATLSEQIAQLQQTLSQIEGVPGQEAQEEALKAQISSLQEVVQLLNADNMAIGGMESYLGGLSAGAGELYSGAAELAGMYEKFDEGIRELAGTVTDTAGSITQLTAGMNTLASKYGEFNDGLVTYTDGAKQLYSSTSGMGAQVQEQIDGILSSLGGGSEAAESFVSDKNTDVKSVQFVIKTDAIEKPEAKKNVEKEKKDESFIRKLADLF